jgi:O-antigen/teichoic acid export membrane protein
LISIPINYIDAENYGVWLTISSIVTWINIFDIGLISSLRNKITEALVSEDWQTARMYTSTTYALLILIIVPVWVLLIFIFRDVNWGSVFNSSVSNETLESIVLFAFTSFCLQFILKPIISILTADQQHSLANFIYLITNVLSIGCLVLFERQLKGSLYLISILLGFMPCVVLVVLSIILFFKKYRKLCPTIGTINFGCRKELLGLGFKFFIIQIAGVIIFSANNFIIAHMLGNEQVTYYNIVFRYFSIITIGYSLVNAPFWTAYSEAYFVKDWQWIRKVTKQANQLCAILWVVIIIMLFISTWVYKVWINQTIEIPFALSALMALYVGITLYCSTYTSFINGTGKIRLQSYLSVFVSIFHIPIGYFLIKVLDLGLNGLIILSIIWSLISLLLWSIQYKKIMEKSSVYIWN